MTAAAQTRAKRPAKGTKAGPRLRIRYDDVNKLIPYARNARTHKPADVAAIAASIKEFGFTNPVLLDGDRGILAGHGRVLAAQVLEIDKIPTIDLAHLSKTQQQAYVIADNQLATKANWDDELLRLEVGDLRGAGFEAEITGFSAAKIDKLLAGAQELGAMPTLPDGDKPPFQNMTFNLHDTQADTVKKAVALAKGAGPFDGAVNDNTNANALARICDAYLLRGPVVDT